jgi:MFS family permease
VLRSLLAIALGLMVVGLGLYGAPAVTPFAFPAAFDAQQGTRDPIALSVMLAITTVFSAFGGWVTARLVDNHRTGHAVFMSVVGLAVAVFIGAVRWATAPAWYFVAAWCLMPIAAAIGAAAWERSLRRLGPTARTTALSGRPS